MQAMCKGHKRLKWILAGLLGLLAMAVFHRTLHANFFQWDDYTNIYGNPHIQGLDAERLQWMFTDFAYVRRYIPLGWLGWAMNYELCGLNPASFHLGNILFHGVNTILVFFLIRKLLSKGATMKPREEESRGVLYCSAAGAILWAIHPFRVESVAWASGRLHLQATFFLLVSVLCYLQFEAAPAGKSRTILYWTSVLGSAASLLTYPIGLPLIAILVVLDLYPLRRFNPGLAGLWDARAQHIWLEKVPYVVVVGFVFGLTLWARINAAGGWSKPPRLEEFPFYARAMQAFYVWAYYAWKPWVPFHLSPFYTTLMDFDPNSWPFWLSAGVVISATLLVMFWRKRWPWALVLWISHLILLVPVLGMTERPHYTSDRYDYLPGLVWAVLLAAAFWKTSALPRLRAVGATLGGALVVLFAGLSFHQTRIWRDSVVLFEYIISELGNDPHRADIHMHLASFYARNGRDQEAIQQCNACLGIKPIADAWMLLAQLHGKNGNIEGALTNCLALAEFRPDPETCVMAGNLFYALGRRSDAINQYRRALALLPDSVFALNNLAWILATDTEATNRNGEQAVRLAEQACKLTNSNLPVFVETLAAAYAEAGRFDEAVETAQKAAGMAEAAGESDRAEKSKKLLELYRARHPHRE